MIEFNHQRGGASAGAVGNITHERVYIKSSFSIAESTTVLLCQGPRVSEESVEPHWPIFGLNGDWKPSSETAGLARLKIGTIQLKGDGLYFLRVDGYIDTFFEVVGETVISVPRKELQSVVERLFGDQVAKRQTELASIKAARDEEADALLREANNAGWPVLNGSERQVAWAISIRSKVAKRNPGLPELLTRTAAKYWIDNYK